MGFLFALFLIFINVSYAGPACFEIFTVPPAIGIQPEFDHTGRYTVDLARPLPIKNQCSLPLCHIYSWSSQLENPKGIEISPEYLNVVYMFRTAMRALDNNHIGGYSSNLGATPIWSHINIAASGLIPKSAWPNRVDFKAEPTATRMTEAIENIIANAIILRKNTSDPAIRENIKQEAIREIDQLFGTVMGGSIPKSFMYEGKEYTPHTFAQQFFPELYAPIVRVTVDDLPKATRGQTTDNVMDVSTNVRHFEQIAKAVLDSGQTLQLGYQHNNQYVDVHRGVMSISAFNYPALAVPPPRWVRSQNRLWSGMHAVELVGYELNPLTGQVAKWKIRNSWGTTAGDKGYYHMYADYFRTFVYQLAYANDGKTPVPAFTADPVQLSLPFE